jgi:Transketolase, C-terminal subunit
MMNAPASPTRTRYTFSEKKDTRSGFGAGLLEAGRLNPNVVALCADLTGSLKMDAFKKEFPDRFFQVGIAEANMMGVAAGLTIGGKIPFTGTFANFSTGRVYDQIRQSIAYSHKNVKICASHAGLTLGEDGATHQMLEDIGMMKMLPGMTVSSLAIITRPKLPLSPCCTTTDLPISGSAVPPGRYLLRLTDRL